MSEERRLRWFTFHARLILLAAWLSIAGQGVVAFEAAWHHHGDAPAGHKDGCGVCAAVSEHGTPVAAPEAVAALEFVEVSQDVGRQMPAHLYVLAALCSRGPPLTLAV